MCLPCAKDEHWSHSRPAWSQRLFAWVTEKSEAFEKQLYDGRKRALFGDLAGEVLEIGPGTGANLPYFPPGIRWIGVEPNLYMHRYLREKAERLGMVVDLRTGAAERLEVAENSVDAVVMTLVLCSVSNVADALHEVLRVLKPSGRFVFIEHVAAPSGTRLRSAQRLIRPLWKVMGDGCNPDRETWVALDNAGFDTVSYERFEVAAPLKIAAPTIAGMATKRQG